jgi:hypothetical protein
LTLPEGSVVGTEFLVSLFVLPLDTFVFLPDFEFGFEVPAVECFEDEPEDVDRG